MVEGMCYDCDHCGPCCDFAENTECTHQKEDGSCWKPYRNEKLDRSRWEGCVVCNKCGVSGENILLCNGTEAQYCPFCGRPLTEKAWAEPERRIKVERLTERWCAGGIRIKGCSTLYPDVKRKSAPMASAIARLAAYEDTWLEPEEVTSMKNAIMGQEIAKITEFDGIPIQRMQELAQAEKDGRLLVLPCKVGDIVWTNIAIVGDRYKSADKPYPVEVVFIGIGGHSNFFHVQYSNGRTFTFDFDKFGKTVFLTREEAEAALKKREEADNEAE